MREFFRHNGKLKLTALLLAMLLELYFYSPDNSVTKVLRAKLVVRNVPATMIVLSPDFRDEQIEVKVTVRGPAPIVRQLEHDEIVYTVSYPANIPASYVETVKREEMKFAIGATGVDVLNVEPANIEFVAEKLLRKQLAIRPKVVGKAAEGFKVGDLQVKPTSIFVSGPLSKLKGVDIVDTQAIDIEGINASKSVEIPLQRIDNWVRYNVDVVTVDVSVEKEAPRAELQLQQEEATKKESNDGVS